MDFIVIVLRSIVMYFTVLITIRFLGKRTMAELTPVDRVSGITFGTIAGSVSVNVKIALWMGIAGIMTFGVVSWVMGRLTTRFPVLRTLAIGSSHRIISQGKVIPGSLKKVGFTPEDVTMRLREVQIKSVRDVEEGFLETDGHLGLVMSKSKSGRGKEPGLTPT